MDEQMEEVCEKVCVFEESLEIDFEYEFDVAKFFDFLRPESPEEIEESERWFHLAQGHPPSPLLVKLNLGAEDLGGSETSSPKYERNNYSINSDDGESEVFSPKKGHKGPQMLKPKSKSTSRSCLPKSSRLLQPTASQLAKQNQQIGVPSMRVVGRLQKLGSPLKSPGDVAATKRQKLEIGYLLKVAHLKHQTSFSHKIPKKVGASNVNSSHARPKVTVPKEPDLETANRAERHRSKNSADLSSHSKYNTCSYRAMPLHKKTLETQSFVQPKKKNTPPLLPEFQGESLRSAKGPIQRGKLQCKRTNSSNVLIQEKSSDQVYRFNALPLNKKVISSKGDIGFLRNHKREATVPKEFKLSSSKKLSQNPPIELFSKLSLNPENQNSSLLEKEHPVQAKGTKKNVSCSIMKENKNSNTVTGKSTRCCLKQSQFKEGGLIIDMGNHLTSARSLAIH